MRLPIGILMLLFLSSAGAQNYTLARSEIKMSTGISSGGQYQVSGAVETAEARSAASSFVVEGSFTPLTFIPPAPRWARIQIIRESNTLTMLWPQSAIGFHLEMTSDLRTPGWTIINPQRGTQSVYTTVTVPYTPGQNYFRLRHASTLP